ncbi:AAA family ATPase [Novosphingobium sp. FSY-8]|uniref:AAA family ATPase n=1 Tax=Novosphingobium ovatum TaxID=1908523 RepID=A0ABW9XBJ3_9SPHN|nr:division plane positioning ATPase MipZ [Novosphingobium ovatum]NBC35896.1 AAA family ATPase [Novosphingobium ovatum]
MFKRLFRLPQAADTKPIRITPPPSASAPRRNVNHEGEHPLVVVNDIASRPRPDGRIIVVANEKGGVGKSTLAFHTCIALCDAGYSVSAIDLDFRQQSLARALSFREATSRRLDVDLPSPTYTAVAHTTGALLCQEIARIGWKSDYIIIDVAGSDSPLARRAIAMADTLLTPINSSFVDLDLLGRFNPTTLEVVSAGFFSRMVSELREERLRRNLSDLDWLVMPNRLRSGSSHNQARFEAALARLAPNVGFRVGSGMSERVAYRELFLLGLTHLDLRHIPSLHHMKAQARDEITTLMADLNIEEYAPRAENLPMPDIVADLAAGSVAA